MADQKVAYWRLILLSASAGALDLGYAIEASYAVPILQNVGISLTFATVTLALAPIFGLLFQPFLGALSDQCKVSWGRRKPFILVLSLMTIIGYGASYVGLLSKAGLGDLYIKILVVALVALLDFSIGQLQLPTRAFLLDVVPVSQSQTANFIFMIIILVYATLGYGLGAVDWSKLFGENFNTMKQAQVVFGLGAVITFLSLLSTLFSIKEKLPNDSVVDETMETRLTQASRSITATDRTSINHDVDSGGDIAAGCEKALPIQLARKDIDNESPSDDSEQETTFSITEPIPVDYQLEPAVIEHSSKDTTCQVDLSRDTTSRREQNILTISAENLQDTPAVGEEPSTDMQQRSLNNDNSNMEESTVPLIIEDQDCGMEQREDNLLDDDKNRSRTNVACFTTCISIKPILLTSVSDVPEFIYHMSYGMWILWLVMFFDFFGEFAFIYGFTTFVGTVVYGGVVTADSDNESEVDTLYTKGVRMGSLALAVSTIFGGILSLVLNYITKWIRLKTVLLFCLAYAVVALFLMIVLQEFYYIALLALFYGPFLTVLLTVPFALIPIYKDRGVLFRKDWPNASDDVVEGKACAVLNTAIFAGQIAGLLVIGPIVEAAGDANYFLVVSSIAITISFLISIFIHTPKKKRISSHHVAKNLLD